MERTTLVAIATAAIAAGVLGFFGSLVGSRLSTVRIAAPHPPKDCRGKDCDVTIYFDCADPKHPTTQSCEPYVIEDYILTNPNHKLVFTLDAIGGFQFDTKGIEFTSANSDNHFNCQPQGAQQYKCDILNGTPPDVYKYTIRVKGMQPVDPWVVNY